jgi:peptidoglycan/LPS O-acetylase OafA/YrhL
MARGKRSITTTVKAPRRYSSAVDEAVADTPPDRNRVVDTWRVGALLIVVFGHWLAASVWMQPDGSIIVMNTLEWIPYAAWATWLVQVMPIFFFVGGYSNAAALSKRTLNRRSWITNRFRRLYAPAVPVIVVWTAVAFVLRPFVDPEILSSGVLNATIPLWFLAVYLTLIGFAPISYALWNRWGMATVVALVAASIAVDIAHIAFGIGWIAWINLLFVWGAVHQLGYWWYTRRMSGTTLPHKSAIALSLVSLALLIGVTWVGFYPVSMLDIPGSGRDNTTPPTAALLLLGLIQIGIILATAPRVSRFALRPRAWRFIVGTSGLMMTIYVWHLTSLTLVLAAASYVFDGAFLRIEPGTALWWATRPVFFVLLIGVTAALHVPFARFETDVSRRVNNRSMFRIIPAMTAGIVVLAATSYVYLINEGSRIHWWIPILAVVTAVVMKAYPTSWRLHPDVQPIDNAMG